MFTDGKDRFYETLMKETPNSRIKSGEQYNPKFRYRYRDFDCQYCLDYRKYPPERLCPYIMDNLEDLKQDDDFIRAVQEAEVCDTPHKLTLLYLLEH